MPNIQQSHFESSDFDQLARMVEEAQARALQRVNEELVLLYFNVGKLLSEAVKKTSYGDAFVDGAAEYMRLHYPQIKGFNRRGLYRMKQFYETYASEFEIVSALLTQLNWTCRRTGSAPLGVGSHYRPT